MTEKYTKQEIIALADATLQRCRGMSKCEKYQSRLRGFCEVADTLIADACMGCAYSLELSWGAKHRWCSILPPKQGEDAVKYLRSLTWANLGVATRNLSR